MIKKKNIKIFSVLFVFFLLVVLVACNGNKIDKTLPDIEGLTEAEIREEFNKRELIVTLDIKDYYEKGNTERKGVKYAENLKVGDEISNGAIITIYLTSNSIQLPNLTGLTRDEIVDLFASLGVDRTNLTLRPDIDSHVDVGTFIAYENSLVGQNFDFTNKLIIRYDISQSYDDLTGLNKYEIALALDEKNISFVFSYEVDNSKEFDTFKAYKNVEVGDRLTPGDSVEVILYSNDNIDNNTGLIISKYVDGVGNNRAIELYNATANSINLSDYYLAILENASLVPTQEIALTGMLNAGDTFVIVKEGAETALLDKADLVSNKMTFDGNDTIQLRKVVNNTFIDQIYHPGNVSLTMDEEVYIRKATTVKGNRIFTQTEWIGFIPTYLEPVGIHPWDETEILNPEFLYSDVIYSNYGMVSFQYYSAADGDTVYGVSTDPRDPVDFTGDNRIRFIMVDTPETQKPGVAGQPYANVAANFTRTLLESATNIYIHGDPSGTLIDTYGRHLGMIWFEIEEDISFDNITADGSPITINKGYHLLNFILLKYGLGEKNIAKTVGYKDAPIFSNRYLYQWGNEAENYAKENKLGVYSGVVRS